MLGTRTLDRVMTYDEADWEVLSRANVNKNKFAVPIQLELPEPVWKAFERGIDSDWFILVDLSLLMDMPQLGLCKIFKLTEKGIARRAELAKTFGN